MSTELQLRVPKIQLTELSFTHADADAFHAWIDDLPKANLGELSRQLYHCFLEFNQLALGAEKRLQLLELLRPLTYFTLEGLSKHYLNSSLNLTEHQRKAANLAQSLQNHLAVGYKHVILGLIGEYKLTHLPTALHRALTEMSLTHLRACHLYCRVPAQHWLECHQLFKLANQHQLLEQSVIDEENTPGTPLSLLNNYKRLLLFSLSNSNHLRQKEQLRVFNACSHWCQHSRLFQGSNQGVFTVDLNRDLPPSYHVRPAAEGPADPWQLDTAPLCTLLMELSSTEPQEADHQQTLPVGIDQSMLRYLARAWGPMTERAFLRTPGKGQLELSVGFSATHFFLSGEEEFNDWLEFQGSARHQNFSPQSSGSDAWSQAVDVRDDDLKLRPDFDSGIHFNRPEPIVSAAQYPLFEARILDASPGGYNILWQDQIPAQLQAGEVLGIRQDARHWYLAVVRWLRLQGNQRIQVGLQLLAPQARPGAIAVVHKSGGLSQFMRCFLLPADPASGTPATLVTPRISFQVGYKVRIVDGNLIRTARLIECCEQTASYAQFHFNIPQAGPAQADILQPDSPAPDRDVDDDLWDKL